MHSHLEAGLRVYVLAERAPRLSPRRRSAPFAPRNLRVDSSLMMQDQQNAAASRHQGLVEHDFDGAHPPNDQLPLEKSGRPEPVPKKHLPAKCVGFSLNSTACALEALQSFSSPMPRSTAPLICKKRQHRFQYVIDNTFMDLTAEDKC